MRKLVIILVCGLFWSQAAMATHHSVFISRIVKLSNTECAVELEISSNNQDAFETADEIRMDGSTLIALGAFATTINNGAHDNGDKILATSPAFESFASLAGDLNFGNSKCSDFDVDVIIAFYIAAGSSNCLGGVPCEIDTVESANVSGWTGNDNEAIESSGGNASFVDFDCSDVSVTNNLGSSVTFGTDACGNGSCDCGETSSTCLADCPAVCGNGNCEPGENNSNCPDDCSSGGGGTCGNGFCTGGENVKNCPQDCTAGSVCGNAVCEGDESATSCVEDCGGSDAICGDNVCAGAENSTNCPADCVTSSGAVCGDDSCDADETEASCVADCTSAAATPGGCSLTSLRPI